MLLSLSTLAYHDYALHKAHPVPAFQLRAVCGQAPRAPLCITTLELARVPEALLPLPLRPLLLLIACTHSGLFSIAWPRPSRHE